MKPPIIPFEIIESEKRESFVLIDGENNFHGISGSREGLKMFERIPNWRVITFEEWKKIDSPNIAKDC